MEPFAVYKDIQARTKGQFLLGVVGPVRTGKSTFIRRFMELLALPGMEEQDAAEVRDQLPVSGSVKKSDPGTFYHRSRSNLRRFLR